MGQITNVGAVECHNSSRCLKEREVRRYRPYFENDANASFTMLPLGPKIVATEACPPEGLTGLKIPERSSTTDTKFPLSRPWMWPPKREIWLLPVWGYDALVQQRPNALSCALESMVCSKVVTFNE